MMLDRHDEDLMKLRLDLLTIFFCTNIPKIHESTKRHSEQVQHMSTAGYDESHLWAGIAEVLEGGPGKVTSRRGGHSFAFSKA